MPLYVTSSCCFRARFCNLYGNAQEIFEDSDAVYLVARREFAASLCRITLWT